MGTAVRFYAHQQCSEVNGCGVHLSLAQSLDRMSELAYEKMREGTACVCCGGVGVLGTALATSGFDKLSNNGK